MFSISLGLQGLYRATTSQGGSYCRGCTTLTVSGNYTDMAGMRDITHIYRTEAGYCGIQYKESTGQTPDTFDFFPNEATNAEASAGMNYHCIEVLWLM